MSMQESNIIVFEYLESPDQENTARLDFRFSGQSLPIGAIPLIIADTDGKLLCRVARSQYFEDETVDNYLFTD